MQREYEPQDIEKKWQKYWQDQQTFAVTENESKQKFYALIEFPYPSGEGLHTGHLRSNTAMDIIARYKRMLGFNVLYPIGFDAFGLPAENYAIKKNIAPQISTKQNIANFTRQLKESGFSFDWSRSFSTTDPEYYKWTQWIFIQMFKAGLAYKASEMINWCTSCKIGLANEEVVAGQCERCGGEVVKKEKEQWILRITKYADRLIDDLGQVDFLDRIKAQQINWIGRSEGAEVIFKIRSFDQLETGLEVKVFTTRPDTLFGVTYLALSPEHEILSKLKNQIKNWSEVEEYMLASSKKSDLERSETDKEKTGVKIEGLEVINPVNKQTVPLFVADYVLANYGFGAVMAVPAHDQRDWEFAKKFNLDLIPVVKTTGDLSLGAQEAEGQAINSGQFDGLETAEFKEKIVTWLEKNNTGQKAVNYKLRDWIFSRQRYWGEPIPMIYCQKCDWQAVPVEQLPVVLPDIEDFLPTEDGQSPLAKVESWVKTTCPQCGGPAERETDVMPNWAGSNWYFIRYCDPQNSEFLIDPKKASYWLPVDWYNGGMEHTTLHLLYSRFVYKFLYDIKAVPEVCGSEPYAKRTAQGMILGAGGIKMSKSKGNVINPDSYVQKFGADTVRLYEMFMGPFDQSIAWDDQGVIGMFRFLKKVFALQAKVQKTTQDSEQVLKILHQSIKKVGLDIENMRFNTAVAQLTIFLKELEKAESISESLFSKFILILAPFAPHLAEEIWQVLGHKNTLAYEIWPEYDQDLAKDENVILGIQVNGKLKDTIELPLDTEDSVELKSQVLALAKIETAVAGQEIKKYIHVKNKIISIVV